jgi:hypothetical protein
LAISDFGKSKFDLLQSEIRDSREFFFKKVLGAAAFTLHEAAAAQIFQVQALHVGLTAAAGQSFQISPVDVEDPRRQAGHFPEDPVLQ